MINYKETYKTIYKQINLGKVLESYNINCKTYTGNKGKEYLLSCPFPDHDDLTPSFSFNDNTGIWHCFLCGGGDFFKFIKIMEGFQKVKQAIDFIKKKLGIVDNLQIDFDYLDNSFKGMEQYKKKEIKYNEEEIKLKEIDFPESRPAEEYFSIVQKRVDLEAVKKWKMRYCENPKSKHQKKYHGRLIIPIYIYGKLVSFAARDMLGRAEKWNEVKKDIKQGKYSTEEKQKLIDKYEFKKILYPFGAPISYVFFNWDKAIENRKYVILVEGILDAIKLISYGYNTLAILSCNLNDYRVNLLMQHFDTIYIALDNDNSTDSKGNKQNPGQQAAQKIIDKKFDDADVYNVLLPVGKDPDECEKDEFRNCLERSRDTFEKLVYF